MKKMILAVLMAASFTVSAGNDNANPCGNNGNNCGGAPVANGGSGGAGGDANAVGVAIAGAAAGAIATGGDSNAIANGGTAFGGSANVGDIRNTNTNTALGGAGGSVIGSGNSHNDNTNVALGGAGGKGGDANQAQGQLQGQQQGQGQQQSNVGINGQQQGQSTDVRNSSTNTVGQSQSTDASSKNDNRSTASGNATDVTTKLTVDASDNSVTTVKYERNAPPVYLGALTASMSCAGSFNAGGSDRNGSGAFGFTWISKDCQTVVAGRDFLSIGMVDTACKIWKTTKGYKRAAKVDPSLNDVSCTAAK